MCATSSTPNGGSAAGGDQMEKKALDADALLRLERSLGAAASAEELAAAASAAAAAAGSAEAQSFATQLVDDGGADNDEDLEARLKADLTAREGFLSITVIGASGDLAKKKIYPALFALYYEGHIKEDFVIFGYARSRKTRPAL